MHNSTVLYYIVLGYWYRRIRLLSVTEKQDIGGLFAVSLLGKTKLEFNSSKNAIPCMPFSTRKLFQPWFRFLAMFKFQSSNCYRVNWLRWLIATGLQMMVKFRNVNNLTSFSHFSFSHFDIKLLVDHLLQVFLRDLALGGGTLRWLGDMSPQSIC
jgi:hypothetical protein